MSQLMPQAEDIGAGPVAVAMAIRKDTDRDTDGHQNMSQSRTSVRVSPHRGGMDHEGIVP